MFTIILSAVVSYGWNSFDLMTKGIMIFVLVLLIFGTIISIIGAERLDGERKVDNTKQIYRCQHCGEEFNSKKLKEKHEKSCVEMKI